MSKGGPAPHHANSMETAGSVIVPEFGHMKQLYIVDALRFGETTRGPQYFQKSLIFGTDPVATDMIALEVFLRNCKTYGELPPTITASLPTPASTRALATASASMSSN